MIKVLFISTSLPPVAESQTIRNVFLIRGLQLAGMQVRAISPYSAGGGDATLSDVLPAPLVTIRTKPTLYARLARAEWLPPGRIQWIYRTLLREGFARVTVPDSHFDWQRLAVAAGRVEIEREPPDVLVTSCGSFTALFAGATLAREYRLPWISDAGDPLTLNPLPPLSYGYMRFINGPREREALKYCSALTLTTRETVAAYQSFLTRPITLYYLPCGYSVPKTCTETRSPDDALTMTYVGVAGRGNRDLRDVMRAFATCAREIPEKKFRMVVVGTGHPAFSQEAHALRLFAYRATGWVSYEESLVHIHKSDILLLRGNRGGMQIPAKAYNYMAAGVPILYVGEVGLGRDPTRSLVETLPGVACCTACYESSNAALHRILREYKEFKTAATARAVSSDVKKFAWENIGAKFAEIVYGVANR